MCPPNPQPPGPPRLPPQSLCRHKRLRWSNRARRKRAMCWASPVSRPSWRRKKTAEIIPLCHPLPLSHIAVDFTLHPARAPEKPHINIVATVKTTHQTGVEMEALTAVSIAALTIYDMLKAADKAMTIGDIRLLEKRGGKSDFFGGNSRKCPPK